MTFPPAFSFPIKVGKDTWQMRVHHAVCRDDSWVVDLVLVGPRMYTLQISTGGRQEPEMAAQAVVSLAREWLLLNGNLRES